MKASELHDLLLTKLIKARGGTRQDWRRALGSIKIYSMHTHPHCNWDVHASGTVSQMAAVDMVVDAVRAARPHVDADDA